MTPAVTAKSKQSVSFRLHWYVRSQIQHLLDTYEQSPSDFIRTAIKNEIQLRIFGPPKYHGEHVVRWWVTYHPIRGREVIPTSTSQRPSREFGYTIISGPYLDMMEACKAHDGTE